jgi:hypothetical protein
MAQGQVPLGLLWPWKRWTLIPRFSSPWTSQLWPAQSFARPELVISGTAQKAAMAFLEDRRSLRPGLERDGPRSLDKWHIFIPRISSALLLVSSSPPSARPWRVAEGRREQP